MRSKEYKAFIEIQSFICRYSTESNRDEMENLGKCLRILESAIRELEFIHKKTENVRITPLEALKNIKFKLMRSYDDSIGMNGNVMFEKEIPIIESALKALEIIKEKVPLIYLFAGFVGKYDPEEIEIIKEVYIND